MLSTAGSKPLTSQRAASSATLAAVANSGGLSSRSMLTAIAGRPMLPAVKAAPTVPECTMARPVLTPGLMPDTTRSGGAPNPPRMAVSTARAGGPSTANACTPGRPEISTGWNSHPLADVDGADGGAASTALLEGSDQQHVARELAHGGGQSVQPGRREAVV